jgi:hypothetical protein
VFEIRCVRTVVAVAQGREDVAFGRRINVVWRRTTGPTNVPGSGGERTMSGDRLCPIDEHLPPGKPKGCILIVSDYRPLNLGHAATLCKEGYAVYTAVTCTDVPRIFERYTVGDFDLVVFASLVHGWHHGEGERRPGSIPQTTDPEWQTRNMREVIDIVCGRQGTPPRVLIAVELMALDWYRISADALAAVGVEYQTYSASDPHAIIDFLR